MGAISASGLQHSGTKEGNANESDVERSVSLLQIVVPKMQRD